MNFNSGTVNYKNIQQDAQLAELYSQLYTIPKAERVKVLMSWLVNAYSDLLIPVLSEIETLATFTVHVRLLDTFGNNASYETIAELATEFSDQLLTSQVVPNLLENHEKASDTTYHLQIICEHLTCPTLIRRVMDVVTKQLTSIFIIRMTSDDCLVAASTLSLIKTLLEFYCEDFWYDLILQYLLPMKHLLRCQRQKRLPEIEFQESTQKLLELVPNHVMQATDPSLLSAHFLLYYQDELTRLRVVDNAVASSLPSSTSDLLKVGLGLSDGTRHPGKNATYPMWIFRYDGTDFVHAYRKGTINEEPEDFFENDLFSAENQLHPNDLIPSVNVVDVDEGNQSGEELDSPDISIADQAKVASELDSTTSDYFPESRTTSFDVSSSGQLGHEFYGSFVKDKRHSLDSLDDGAYFGPFLQTLFEILRKWTSLDPAVLFTATEIVSVLASSRIPLVTTIFLDMSLTLQPSYPNFLSLAHVLKNELDYCMNAYPDYIFRNVWKAAAKDCTLVDFYTKNGLAVGNDDESEEDSLVSKLTRSLSNSKSLRMAAQEVQKTMGRRGSSFRAFTDIFKSSNKQDSIPEFRLLNRSANAFENEEQENLAKVMALRSILFTHWMLELAAIALQLSWGRRLLNGCGTSMPKHDDHDSSVTSGNTTNDSDDGT